MRECMNSEKRSEERPWKCPNAVLGIHPTSLTDIIAINPLPWMQAFSPHPFFRVSSPPWNPLFFRCCASAMLWLPPNPKEDSLILARFAIDEHNKNEVISYLLFEYYVLFPLLSIIHLQNYRFLIVRSNVLFVELDFSFLPRRIGHSGF